MPHSFSTYNLTYFRLITCFIKHFALNSRTSASPAPTRQPAFPRNTSSRSTFHSGQTRPRATYTQGSPGDSPHSARTSFFSKISSKFSKRQVFSGLFSFSFLRLPYVLRNCDIVTHFNFFFHVFVVFVALGFCLLIFMFIYMLCALYVLGFAVSFSIPFF